MKITDVIAEILKREGISLANCYPRNPIIESMASVGIQPIVCRQERVGVDAAHGYARVSNGSPVGVFAMQSGPGAENAFPGIASAFSDSAPVLLLPTGHERDRSQVFPLFKSSRTYASVTKLAEEVLLPEEVTAVMRRAFSALKNGRLGPVLVEIPSDLLHHELGTDVVDYRPVRAVRPAADPRDVDEAARILVNAACPVIQAGQGVLYAQASDELHQLAELLQAPVMTTVDGKSAFAENHPLALGAGASVIPGALRHFIRKSDVVFGIGCSFTRHPLYPPLPKGRTIIHATNDPRDLYKCYDIDQPLFGDAKLVLAALVEAVSDRLGGVARDTTVAAEIRDVDDAWLREWRPILVSDEVPITPYRVISEFMRVINPDDAIVTHDSGSPREQIVPFYRATKPHGYLGWGKSHALGGGLGLIIGAKLAAPEKLCVNFMGDAAFGMTGLDFETAVRCGVPIMTIVLNNSTMAIETDFLQISHTKYRTRDVGGSYAALARDLGGYGEKISDPAAIGDAILKGRRLTEDGTPVLLEFITSAETRFSFLSSDLFPA